MLPKLKETSNAAATYPVRASFRQVPVSITASEESAEKFAERIIEEIPTVFGRLTYLASLCDPERGTYRHPILCRLSPAKYVDVILRKAHKKIFSRWLEFNLRQQTGDLTRYLGLASVGHVLLRQMRDCDAFCTLLPLDAGDHERALFSSDLAVIINAALMD